jgi:hypothetical protein
MTLATSGQPIHFADAQDVGSAAQSDNLTTTAEDKIDRTPRPVAAGDYLLMFYCEHMTDNAGASGCRVTVLIDSSEKAEDNWNADQWHSFSGTTILTLADGDTPRIQMQFKRIGGAATVSIRRAYVALVPVSKSAPS